MPFATVDGARVYYETHGAGPALMLVHGPGGHHAIWWQQVGHFAQHFTVVLPNLRGFGKCERSTHRQSRADDSAGATAIVDEHALATVLRRLPTRAARTSPSDLRPDRGRRA